MKHLKSQNNADEAMKSNERIIESLNSFIKHQFIKRNTGGKNFEEHSIMWIREQRETPECSFEKN